MLFRFFSEREFRICKGLSMFPLIGCLREYVIKSEVQDEDTVGSIEFDHVVVLGFEGR